MAKLNLTIINTADIRGAKTRMRPMRLDEVALIYPWTLDPDVNRFWGAGEHYDNLEHFLRVQADEALYFDGSKPEYGRCYTVEVDDQLIGMINFNEIDTTSRRTEIDVVIGHPDYGNRGYGSDALRAFLAFLFDEVGLHSVWLTMIAFTTAPAASTSASASSRKASCAKRNMSMANGTTPSSTVCLKARFDGELVNEGQFCTTAPRAPCS